VGRWNPNVQQTDERWKLIDLRESGSGSVHLMPSENDGRWGVQTVNGDENVESSMVGMRTSSKRVKRLQNINERRATDLRRAPQPKDRTP
jgi:hypothetical protein